MAQSALRTCAGVDLTSPADGAVLDGDYRTNFTWDSEPRGTASREWVSVRVDGDGNVSFDDAKHVKAEPRLYKGFARGRPGIYAWAVIFYDANGNPLCISEPRTYIVAGGSTASLSSDGSASGPAAAATAKAALGRYIIVLTGNGSEGVYGGSAPVDRYFASNHYDDTSADNDGWQAKGYTGLEIWGNKNSNKIVGSDLSDVINGGNETCVALCGDNIEGRGGDDIINGGNESCFALCGDVIAGGSGNDVIKGGGGDDVISGGADDDTIDGGSGSDLMFGNDGDDNIDTNNPGNGGLDTGIGGSGSDNCQANVCI